MVVLRVGFLYYCNHQLINSGEDRRFVLLIFFSHIKDIYDRSGSENEKGHNLDSKDFVSEECFERFRRLAPQQNQIENTNGRLILQLLIISYIICICELQGGFKFESLPYTDVNVALALCRFLLQVLRVRGISWP